ncbi:unnamed protein product [Citrullus colocynthis]|uniref:Cysteine proteinase inhibitor n=1 Tax=Citrullus colocynthis TaxID=252529 RepID=A0ABP0YJD6_9ROSI
MKVNRMVLLLLLLAVFDLGFSVEDPLIRMKPGGVCDYIGAQNSVEIDSLARFAAQERNKNEIVAGKLYHLTLEAINGGKKKVYEAKVWDDCKERFTVAKHHC